MPSSARNLSIYVLVTLAGLFLASRLVTIGLLLRLAPEDAEPLNLSGQIVLATFSAGLIAWLWRKRIHKPADSKDAGRDRGSV